MTYLVDANVLSEATAKTPSPRVIRWLDRHDSELHVSTLTLAEISRGIHLLPTGRKRQQLDRWLEQLVDSFNGRIVEFDVIAAKVWGEFHARNQSQGRTLPSIDSLIAASALAHGHTLATRNGGDFPPEIPVVNPWR